MALLKWIAEQEIEWALNDPGKPWQNGKTESFNDKFWNECLAKEWLRIEPKVVIEDWRRPYNCAMRPRKGLAQR